MTSGKVRVKKDKAGKSPNATPPSSPTITSDKIRSKKDITLLLVNSFVLLLYSASALFLTWFLHLNRTDPEALKQAITLFSSTVPFLLVVLAIKKSKQSTKRDKK